VFVESSADQAWQKRRLWQSVVGKYTLPCIA
jgi:hypothetical protein